MEKAKGELDSLFIIMSITKASMVHWNTTQCSKSISGVSLKLSTEGSSSLSCYVNWFCGLMSQPTFFIHVGDRATAFFVLQLSWGLI